ncbi:hypothetical protein [Providencia alcalifaciens]|uniref:hypothetical protein n=1 Tax=Providencia alcalifaciens TaxID=126385 RepID=UPI003D9885C8
MTFIRVLTSVISIGNACGVDSMEDGDLLLNGTLSNESVFGCPFILPNVGTGLEIVLCITPSDHCWNIKIRINIVFSVYLTKESADFIGIGDLKASDNHLLLFFVTYVRRSIMRCNLPVRVLQMNSSGYPM